MKIEYSISNVRCPKCKKCYLNKDKFGYDCYGCGYHEEIK